MRYIPIGSAGKRYAPEVSTCVTEATPVPWFVAVTEALGTTAPVASVTVPLSDAVDCARAALSKPLKIERREKKHTKFFSDMNPPGKRPGTRKPVASVGAVY